MKRTRLFLATVCLAPFALALVHAKASPTSAAPVEMSPTSAALLGPDIAFKTKFKAAMEKGVKGETEKIVKAESANAAAWIARTAEILADRPDDPEALALSTELATAWKAAMKTTFPDKEKEFFAGLTGQNKKDRTDLRKRIDEKLNEMSANAEKRDGLVYANIVDEIELLAQAFGQVGDFYWSSEAWIAYGACYDEALRGTSADFKSAFKGYDNAISARAKVDLNDSRVDEATKRKTALAAKGADKSAPAGGKDDVGSAPVDAGATVTVPLTFEVVPTAEAYQRPLYTGDELYLLWQGIELKGKSSSSPLQNLPGSPNFYRIGSSDVRVDSDGDGKGDGPTDEKLPLTGNITPVKVNLGKGDDARPWAFLAVTGTDKESYQGIQMNRAPQDAQMTIYTLGAASVTGVLDTVAFRILDDSMDGVYGSTPLSYNFVGLSKDHYQPDMDSIVIGAGKRARPWSEYQEINGKWWKFEPADAGKTIKASPVKVDLGTLKLDYKGGIAPTWLVVQGANEMKNSYFDISEGGAKGVQVPIGRYTLYYGEVQKGKKKQMMKTLILPPKNAANYDVKKGETTVVTLGAPFGFDFKSANVDGKLTIEGGTVVITGSQGERYERAWQCVPRPEVTWRKKGTKKGSKYEKMPQVQDSDTVSKLGWQAAWFPMNLDIDVKGQGEVEVQLLDKKHELFGKVESEWK